MFCFWSNQWISGYLLYLSFITSTYSLNIFIVTEHLTLKTLKNCLSVLTTTTTSSERVCVLVQGFNQPKSAAVKSQMQKSMHQTVVACHTQSPHLISLVLNLILPTHLPIMNLTSHTDLPTGRKGTAQQT